jgi:hypothetical protein
MVLKKRAAVERVFSIDLKSRNGVKTASLDSRKGSGVAIEGTLGVLERAGFLDGTVLEVAGSMGVLRVDLQREELLGIQEKRASGLENGGSS